MCVCVSFSVIIIRNSVYFFKHFTAMCSSTFGKGWVGRSCLYFLVWVSFGSFSLQELTCMHCVYLVLRTRKVLCGIFYALYIYTFSFIHRFLKEMKMITSSHDYPTHTWTMFPSRNVSNNRQSQFKLKTILM